MTRKDSILIGTFAILALTAAGFLAAPLGRRESAETFAWRPRPREREIAALPPLRTMRGEWPATAPVPVAIFVVGSKGECPEGLKVCLSTIDGRGDLELRCQGRCHAESGGEPCFAVDLPEGAYRLVASAPGYASLERTVEVGPLTEGSVRLRIERKPRRRRRTGATARRHVAG